MLKEDCLFYGVSPKCVDSFSSEHVIQASLGGSLQSEKIICGECNKLFGNDVDVDFGALYEQQAMMVSPLLSGDTKRKVRHYQSLETGAEIKISAGGRTALRKIKIDRAKVSVYAPKGTPPKTLEQIMKKEFGVIGPFKIKELPLEAVSGQLRYRKYRTMACYRAAVKNCLEFLRYSSMAYNLQDASRHPSFDKAKKFAALGEISADFSNRQFPYIDFESKLSKIFVPQSELYHRLAVFHFPDKKLVILICQIFGNFPWYFEVDGFEMNAFPGFIGYHVDLLGGNKPSWLKEEVSPISISEFSWLKFMTTTPDGWNFAWRKYWEAYHLQYGKQIFLADINLDEIVQETLNVATLKYDEDPDKYSQSIIDTLKNRYSGSMLFEDIRKLALEIIRSGPVPDSRNVLERYRTILKKVKEAYGFPEVQYNFPKS